MKSKDIARTHGIDQQAFEAWLKSSNVTWKSSALGAIDVEDSQDIAGLVSRYKADRAESDRLAAEAASAQQAEAAVKQRALASMLVTSGFNFDGFTITKYSGYISGDDAVQIDRGRGGFFTQATNVGDSLLAALVKIRRHALAELKEAAYDLGCNAVIGVDFDYLVLDPETVNANGGTLYLPYVFGVTANGNAVVIERNGNPGAALASSAVAAPVATAVEVQPAPVFAEAGASVTPAGWQIDPSGEHRLRWWDGSGWTDHTHD